MLPGLSQWLKTHLMKGRTSLFPLVPMALGMVAGSLGTASFALTQGGLFWGCLSVLIIAGLAVIWDRKSRFRLFGGVITGSLLAALHVWAPWQSYQRYVEPNSAATLTIRVTDPFSDPGPFGFGKRRPRLIARVRDIMLAGEKEAMPCRGKILLVLPPAADVAYGEALRVEGVFSKPELPVPSGAFDYRRFLLSQGIQHVFRVETLSHQSDSTRLATLKRRIYAGRQALADKLVDGFKDERAARAAVAMTLGYRDSLEYETRRHFIRSGTIHIFSISGLHVGIATTVFLLIARFAGIPLILRFRLLPLVLGIYVFLTGCPTSAVRAWVMITAFSLSYSCLRPHVPLNGLALAALVLLVTNPLALFNPGFQFSFVVVIALIAGWRLVRGAVTVCQEKRRWMGRLSTVNYWLRKFTRFCLVVIGCGLAAWLGGAGLLAWNNCLFIPSALWLNVAVALLAFGSLALALGKLALVSFGLSGFSGALTCPLENCLGLIQSLVSMAAEGKGCLAIPQPQLWLVLLYYGFLLLLIVPGLSATWRKTAGLAVVFCLIWMGFGNRMIQPNECVIIHGGGGGATACFIEHDSIPPVCILSGDYWVDTATLEVLKMRGRDTVRLALCPRYGEEPELSVDMILGRLRVERLTVPDRFNIEPSGGMAVSVFQPSTKLKSGLRLPPGIELERFSRRATRMTIQGMPAGECRLTIEWLKNRGVTHCRMSTGDRDIFFHSMPHMKQIDIFQFPLTIE